MRLVKHKQIILSNLPHHKKKGNQHNRNALIMIPRVRAAFLSLRILFELARGSTPMFWPGTAIPLICRCLSSNSAATLDLYNIRSCLSASLYIL